MKLQQQIHRYINQAFLLHRKGKTEYYCTAKRFAALDRLRIFQMMLPDISEKAIARMVVRNEPDLITVLPYYTNLSYTKTRERIQRLITQCKTITIFQHEDTLV